MFNVSYDYVLRAYVFTKRIYWCSSEQVGISSWWLDGLLGHADLARALQLRARPTMNGRY